MEPFYKPTFDLYKGNNKFNHAVYRNPKYILNNNIFSFLEDG